MGEMRYGYISLGNPIGNDRLGAISTDGRIIVKWILKTLGVDFIQRALDTIKWRAHVNIVMNLWVP
jgi:hypothetical protein